MDTSTPGIGGVGFVGGGAYNAAPGTGLFTIGTANAGLTGNYLVFQAYGGTVLSAINAAGALVVVGPPITTYKSGAIVVGTGTLTLPANVTDTVVLLAANQTLTTKTLTAPTINGAAMSGTVTGSLTFSGNPTFSGTVTLSGTISGGTLSGPTLSGTIARLPTFSGSPTFSGTLTLSGTISGGTISGPTLSGTVAGTPTWSSAQTFPSLNSTAHGAGSATAIGLLLGSGTSSAQAGVFTGSNHLLLVGFGYYLPGPALGIGIGNGSGFAVGTTNNVLDSGSGDLSIAGAFNYTGSGAAYVNANLTAADLFWSDSGAGSATAMALAKAVFRYCKRLHIELRCLLRHLGLAAQAGLLPLLGRRARGAGRGPGRPGTAAWGRRARLWRAARGLESPPRRFP